MTDLRVPLQRLFGFDGFRTGQEEVVRAAVGGRDTLAVMPTGSGKSLTYQLAAMLRPEPTLVLSPLIALMKDQVDKLPREVAAQATFVNSSLAADEAAERIAGVEAGATRILYAAPERLRQRGFVELLTRIGVGLVVIDEVHCVSMWGHDFRPDYLFIRRALEALGAPVVLGLTATATPAVATEIATALGRSPDVVRATVVRSNLRYDVERVDSADDRLRVLVERLQRLEGGTAIVYARSRRSCEEIARTLRGHGFTFEHYHAGLEAEERSRIQDDFVGSRLQGVVATTAFGMGIDKADVRFVCLVNHPDSLESYVQMVGRAGRDGKPSDTLLIATDADARTLERFAVEGIPTADDLRRAYRAIRDHDGRIEPEQLAAASGDVHDPRVLVGMLEQAGLAERSYDAGRALQVRLPPVENGARAAVDALLTRYRAEALARAARIVSFAASGGCRHRQVAEHFGETLDEPCGACDVCAPRRAASPRRVSSTLPDDVGRVIVDAVAALRWPLGRKSLVSMLRGSVSAPPTARRSTAYGALEVATDAQVGRWVRALEAAGCLREIVTDDGFRLLEADESLPVPSLAAPAPHAPANDDPLLAALRDWRAGRSRSDGVPAYVVFSDATLREIAAARPTSAPELAGVRGIGPTKLARYGDEVLALVGR